MIKKMITKFEEVGCFELISLRMKKCLQHLKKMGPQTSNGLKTVSARLIVRSSDNSYRMLHKILRNIIHSYPYITHTQEILPANMPERHNFDQEFLSRMDNEWLRNILWRDKRSSSSNDLSSDKIAES